MPNNQTTVDEQSIKENITKYTNEKLADMIISHRYLGLFENVCLMAMEELVRRREAGDTYDFESYIKENLTSLPKLDFGPAPGINTLLQMLKVKK